MNPENNKTPVAPVGAEPETPQGGETAGQGHQDLYPSTSPQPNTEDYTNPTQPQQDAATDNFTQQAQPSPTPQISEQMPEAITPDQPPVTSDQPQNYNMSDQQQSVQSSGQTQQSMPESDMLEAPKAKSRVKRIIVVVILLALFAGAATLTYLWLFGTGNKSASQSASESSSSAQAANLDTLNAVTLTLPTAPAGYTEEASGSDDFKYYMSDDGMCSIVYGTATSEDLPGANLDEIVAPQIDELKTTNGVTVNGPDAGDALILSSATSSDQKYSMPTINYEFSKGSNYATVHYSAVILSDDSRVVANRSCGSTDGPVDALKIQAVDDIASQLLVNL
ncbi:MAG: hypothetical protein PVI21_03615 [Candidatus Woesebacteria bacterium]